MNAGNSLSGSRLICFTLGRGFRAPRKCAVGSFEARPHAIANWKTCPTPCFARRLISSAPLASILRIIASTSGAVISYTSFSPMAGKTSLSMRDQTRSACAAFNALFRFSCQRFATSKKVAPSCEITSPLDFIGSLPSASNAFAAVRLSRAAAIPSSG